MASRQTTYEERVRAFVAEAMAVDRAIDDGQSVYDARDVHAWLEGLATHRRGTSPPKRPRPGCG